MPHPRSKQNILAEPVRIDGQLPAQGLEPPAVAWLEKNRPGLDAYNEHVEKHDVFSDMLRFF